MATFYSAETAGYGSTPFVKPTSQAYGSRVRRYRATITMAAQTTSDNILLAQIPAGSVFCYGIISTTATLGSAVVAIGTNGTHGSNGQYRAAAVFTATDTPTLFGVVATGTASSALTADTAIYLTIATANLPGSGTLVVDLYYSYP